MPTTLLTRHDSLTRLTLAPELGASLVNWTRLSDDWPLLRHSDGQALAANTAHEALPIHGSAWQQTWQLVDATSDSATLQLDSLQPFPLPRASAGATGGRAPEPAPAGHPPRRAADLVRPRPASLYHPHRTYPPASAGLASMAVRRRQTLHSTGRVTRGLKLRRTCHPAGTDAGQCLYWLAGQRAYRTAGGRLSIALPRRGRRVLLAVLPAGAELLLFRAGQPSGQRPPPAGAPGPATAGAGAKLPAAVQPGVPGTR